MINFGSQTFDILSTNHAFGFRSRYLSSNFDRDLASKNMSRTNDYPFNDLKLASHIQPLGKNNLSICDIFISNKMCLLWFYRTNG